MRGRDKFKKYRRFIKIIEVLFGFIPRRAREKLLEHFKSRTGAYGLVIRYALVKTLAKSVGENVSIYPDVYLYKLHNISIGDNVSIHPLCYIDGAGGIDIGNDVSIAHGVSIISFNHRFDNMLIPIKDQELEKKPITIEQNVWVGAKATILAGVIIRSGCVVGAASVVTHDTDANTIVAGIPARIIKIRENGKI